MSSDGYGTFFAPTILLFSAALFAVSACSGPGGGGPTPGDTAGDGRVVDTGVDDVEPSDTGSDGETAAPDGVADGGDADVSAAPPFLCESCSEDADCGDGDDRCLQLLDGNNACASACDLEASSPCPAEYFCARVEENSDTGQCVPEKLTCVDRCSDKNCGDGERCDPITGECREPLGLCDTECTVDSVCGDGPEDRCLTVPGAESPAERMCATGCNPESDDPQCPVDYQCVALNQDDPQDGVCFPVRGTCVDRCAQADCSEGQNCNALTGACEEAQYGACQKGCENSAQCGGQDDLCLDLGIGSGRHCWLDCSGGSEECPQNYDCTQLGGTTTSLCLPSNMSMSCSNCYGTTCFPGGACDPSSGMCTELPEDCTETGCGAGKVCDPRATECVEVGRSCSGDSWAADCDNVVTSCTTRRSGTEGTCERICTSDSDCSAEESCVSTNARDLCLGDELGGARSCGTLHDTSTELGAPCSSNSDCSSGAPTCVDGGDIPGFCSSSCTSDGDCPGDARCATGPGGAQICIPTQCECAVDPALPSGIEAGLQSALSALDTDLCELWMDPERALALEELADTPLASARIDDWIELPLQGRRQLSKTADGLAQSAASPSDAMQRAAETVGVSGSPLVGIYTFPGSTSKLTQATSALIRRAGGTPQTSALEMEASDVPSGMQDLAASIIMAVADAYRARENVLQSAGWGMSRRQEAFDGAPYLLLPGTSSQEMAAPDLSKASVAKAYRDFPLVDLVGTARRFVATVHAKKSKATNRSSWTGFSYVVDTPAGKVVLGGAGDTTYDPAQNSALQGPIAVIVDVGGDDTYRLPAGANTSVANGVSLVVDYGGSDTYTYEKDGHMRDTANLLTSDSDGRKKPASSLRQGNGPVSLSTTARQGAGRVGIGAVIDYGNAKDVYESLRMSQGAAVFGVGMLYDAGGQNDFDAEALSQGAALGGLGVLWSRGGADDFRVWHAGQGFGAAGGTGLLFDEAGSDRYEAVQGETDGDAVLYHSPADKGTSNRSLAQGAGAGIPSGSMTIGLAGGFGLLRDEAGSDRYIAATHAQGYGGVRGVGALSDAAGNDEYTGRVLVQGSGQWFGGGFVDEKGGGDTYNATARLRRDAQGFGEAYGWGILLERGGDDTVEYGNPGGGMAFDGGLGLALFGAGTDDHTLGSLAGWGFARNNAMSGDPLSDVSTIGIFVDTGGASDNYSRPQLQGSGIGNDKSWLQPDPPTDVERGAGVDR